MLYQATLTTTPDDPRLPRARDRAQFRAEVHTPGALIRAGMRALQFEPAVIAGLALDLDLSMRERSEGIEHGAEYTWLGNDDEYHLHIVPLREELQPVGSRVRVTLQFRVTQTDPAVLITQEQLQQQLQQLVTGALQNYVSPDGQVDRSCCELLEHVRLQLERVPEVSNLEIAWGEVTPGPGPDTGEGGGATG